MYVMYVLRHVFFNYVIKLQINLKRIQILLIQIYIFVLRHIRQGHIATGSLRVEETVNTSWSRFCTVNHRASASNYQLSNTKHPDQDSNWRPQRLKASTLHHRAPTNPCEK